MMCTEVSCPGLSVTGLVVRPMPYSSCGSGCGRRCVCRRPHGGKGGGGSGSRQPIRAPQTLVFLGGQVRELLEYSDGEDGSETKTFGVTARALLLSGGGGSASAAAAAPAAAAPMRAARCPVYEPVSDAVLYVEGHALMRLNRCNAVELAAGCELEEGRDDGRDRAARFEHIVALAADGRGLVFLTEGDDVRVLDIQSTEVRTLRNSAPLEGIWTSLSYDAASGALLAATSTAVCRFPPYVRGSGGFAATPRVIAGSWTDGGGFDGVGTAARFEAISSVVAGAYGTYYVTDGSRLRRIDVDGRVSRIAKHRVFKLRGLAFLPGGELACFNLFSDIVVVSNSSGGGEVTGAAAEGGGEDSDGGFAPSCEVLAGWMPRPAGPLQRLQRRLPPLLLLSCCCCCAATAAVLAFRALRMIHTLRALHGLLLRRPHRGGGGSDIQTFR